MQNVFRVIKQKNTDDTFNLKVNILYYILYSSAGQWTKCELRKIRGTGRFRQRHNQERRSGRQHRSQQ